MIRPYVRLRAHIAVVLAVAFLAMAVAAPAPARQFQLDERALLVRHASPALGIEKTFYMYLPPEASEAGRRFPTLYLFRGHEQEWIDKGVRDGTSVIDVYLALRQDGLIDPMILVFPGVTSSNGSVHSAGVNMREPGGQQSIGTGRFEDYIVDDLIPYVDANFPTIADRSSRGVDGFSLGGFISVNLALKHPDLFATAGSFDGSFLYAKKKKPTAINTKDPSYSASIWDAAFGTPRDKAFASANNPITLAAAADEAAVRSVAWLIEFGPKKLAASTNYDRGMKLVAALAAKGAENRLGGPVPNASHTYINADEHMRRALPIHNQLLGGGGDAAGE